MSTNTTGQNLVTDLLNKFMVDDLSIKSAAEDEDKDKDDKKGDDDKEKGDKKPMTKEELAEYEKKEHGGKMPSKEDEEKEKKASSISDLVGQISGLPPELQKLAALAQEKKAAVEAVKAARASAPEGGNAPEAVKSASEKYASGEMSDADYFNEVFFEETAKLASENPAYAAILSEKLAKEAAAGGQSK